MKKFIGLMLVSFANAWAGTGIYVTFNNLSNKDLEYINWETQNMKSHPGTVSLPAKSTTTVYMELNNFWFGSGYNDWQIISQQQQNNYMETKMEMAWSNFANCAKTPPLPYRSGVVELGRVPCSGRDSIFGIGYYTAIKFIDITLSNIGMQDSGAFGTGYVEIEIN